MRQARQRLELFDGRTRADRIGSLVNVRGDPLNMPEAALERPFLTFLELEFQRAAVRYAGQSQLPPPRNCCERDAHRLRQFHPGKLSQLLHTRLVGST